MGLKICIHPASDFDLSQIILGQFHETTPGHKQYLCQVRTSNVYPLQKYDPGTNFARTDGKKKLRLREE